MFKSVLIYGTILMQGQYGLCLSNTKEFAGFGGYMIIF